MRWVVRMGLPSCVNQLWTNLSQWSDPNSFYSIGQERGQITKLYQPRTRIYTRFKFWMCKWVGKNSPALTCQSSLVLVSKSKLWLWLCWYAYLPLLLSWQNVKSRARPRRMEATAILLHTSCAYLKIPRPYSELSNPLFWFLLGQCKAPDFLIIIVFVSLFLCLFLSFFLPNLPVIVRKYTNNNLFSWCC